jgi:hypothetical protein
VALPHHNDTYVELTSCRANPATYWERLAKEPQPNVCSGPVDRLHQLEQMRRSIAMLQPGAKAELSREDAMRLIAELQDVEGRLMRLKAGLQHLVDDQG